MYCPNCGTKISGDQKFCRSCGLALEKIAQSLSEQLPTKLDESLEERKNRLERLGVIALSIFGAGVIIPFLYLVGYKLMLSQGLLRAVLGVLAIIVILGSALFAAIVFAKANEVGEAAAKRRLPPPKEEPETGTTAKLLSEGYLEPVPSVAEHTTELLLAEKKNSAEGS